MIKYTFSTTSDTFDLIKKFLFGFDLCFQSFYIIYLTYRVFSDAGIAVFNYILLGLSVGYLAYFLITNKEFYTPSQIKSRKIAARVIKIAKRIINCIIAGIAVAQLCAHSAENNSIDILMTLLMILGLIMQFAVDGVKNLIDVRFNLIKNAFYMDLEAFKANHAAVPPLLQKIGINFIIDEEASKKIVALNSKYQDKMRRKTEFYGKN